MSVVAERDCLTTLSDEPLLARWQAGDSLAGEELFRRHRDAAFRVAFRLLGNEQDALDAAKAFGVATTGFPFTVFTDGAGNIVTVFVGELHREEATVILRAVTDINAGLTTPALARPRIEEQLDAIRRANRSSG